ncbi:hypothetical protein RHOSPDRAFT_34427 [Rhodotorula sp. JG-1b]|nr:hypothetical protein RHOSPDRAFT_34427 [Rhodotorula sp. JG-1b]
MAPAATKRALALSQSSQSPSQGSQARPKKRPRTQAPASQPSTSAQLAPHPAPTAAAAGTGAPPVPDPTTCAPAAAAAAAAASKVSLPPPKKRTLHKGKLRRLSTGHPHGNTNDTSINALNNDPSVRPRTREKSTLSGAKIGGKSKDLRDRVEAEELWIRRPAKGSTRTKHGLGYSGYLKMGVAAFVERGCTTLTLHALGAAIPLCLSLALAIRDAIPGGEPTGDEPSDAEMNGQEGEGPLVKMEVVTGSKDVHDEITPDDEDEDILYQTRTKSTVSVTLSLSGSLRSSLGAAPPTTSRTGGASRRGKKRSGRGR